MRTATRKQVWTEQQWREYIGRLCRVRLILHDFVFEMRPSIGLRAAHHLKPFKAAHDHLTYAMIRLEQIVAEHLGGEYAGTWSGTINFCQGRFNGEERADQGDTWIAYVKGNAKQSDPPLPRQEWAAWGAKGLEAHNILISAIREVHSAKGEDVKRHVAEIGKAQKKLFEGRSRLDTLVCTQHLQWHDAFKVFFGGILREPMTNGDEPMTNIRHPLSHCQAKSKSRNDEDDDLF